MANSHYFKPRAHILKLLGEELIKSPVMAIYELVKNSYDADANIVNVDFLDLEDIKQSIITVEDNGTGLTSEVIQNVWLEPGTDHRKPIGKDGQRTIKRTPIFKRVPMGEKGVGRFAVHKLGNFITLTTRPANIFKSSDGKIYKKILDYEISLTIDWNKFAQSKYLEEIPIIWEKKSDQSQFHFKNNSGTLIEISLLKDIWTRSMARDLNREIVSMLSPKADLSKFKINLNFNNKWLEEFPDSKNFLDIAPYTYKARLDSNFNLKVDYEFSLDLNNEFGPRKFHNYTENVRGLLIPKMREELKGNLVPEEEINKSIERFEKQVNNFGDISIEIYSYDLDPATLKNYTDDPKTLRNVLKQHYGIKVFKDNMRVFNYGEQGNDWLELDIRRVQNKQWFSNNQNIGFIYLNSSDSTSLIETTNREGFIDNETYRMFYKTIIVVLNEFKNERLIDRNKLLAYIKPQRKLPQYQEHVLLFHKLIDSTDLSVPEQKEELKKEANNLLEDFETNKKILLIPAGVGMTASVALHEIEKLVPRLKESVNQHPFQRDVASEQVDELNNYVQGMLSILRKSKDKPINPKKPIEKAISNYSYKLKSRNIDLLTDFSDEIDTIFCDKRFLITMIMNIIDNSVYWLDTIYKENKGIFIKTYLENDKLFILIVDNGPGFKDDINEIVMPFFSRKEDGIGIGLYLIDTIMMKYGKLDIAYNQELDNLKIPAKYRGAALKLIFNQNRS